MLEESLWQLLIGWNSDEFVEYVLESTTSRERRVSLYDRFSDRPIKELLRANRLGTFLSDWDELVRVRNMFAHGHIPESGHQHVHERFWLLGRKLRKVRGGCMRAFFLIHNNAIEQKLRHMGRTCTQS